MTELEHKKAEQPTPDNEVKSEGISGMIGEAWNWAAEHKTEVGGTALATGLLIATRGRSAAAAKGFFKDASKVELTELEMNAANPIAAFSHEGYRWVPPNELRIAQSNYVPPMKSLTPQSLLETSVKPATEHIELTAVNPTHGFSQGYKAVPLKDSLAQIRLAEGANLNPHVPTGSLVRKLNTDGVPTPHMKFSENHAKTALNPEGTELAKTLLQAQQVSLDAATKAARTVH